MSRWTVRKGVDYLREGEHFIFSEEYGGEGEILTATGPPSNMMGTRVLETEELDFDLEFYGNAWVTMADESDTSDMTVCTWPRDWEENPSNAYDFEHIDAGMTVVVQEREDTREVGADDEETHVVVEAGTEVTVIDVVIEWFHVHVQINPNQPGAGQHVWICPDNLKEKK